MQARIIKFIFITLLLSPIVFLVALAVIAHNINTTTIKKQLSDFVLTSTGLRLNVVGDINLTLLPRLNLKIDNAELYTTSSFRQSDPLMRVMHMTATLNPFSLLSHKVTVDKIYMDTVQAHLQTDIVGHTNWKPLASPKESAKPPIAFAFDANAVMLKHLNLQYDNAQTNSHLTMTDGHLLAKDIDLDKAINFDSASFSHLFRELNITGRLRAQSIRYEGRLLENINVQVIGNKHQFKLSNIEFDIAGGHGLGSATADLTYFVPHYQTQMTLSGLESLTLLTQSNVLKAKKSDITLNIQTQGHGKDILINQANGSITLHALQGSAQGISLETIIDQIHHSFIKVSPIHINDQLKSSAFNQLNAHLTLASGLLHIDDAQMKHEHYRIHAHGLYNIKNAQWDIYLLLNLTDHKFRDIQNELDEFFIDPLKNAVPAMMYGISSDFSFNLDTDFVDINKTILGKSTSQFLKNRGYKLFNDSTYEKRKALYKALYPVFNDDSAAPSSDNESKG